MNVFHIIGGGGHARVIADTVGELYPDSKIFIYDDNIHTKTFGKMVYKGTLSDLELNCSKSEPLVCGIGNLQIREVIIKRFEGWNWVTIVHPTAYVSKTAFLGKGTVVMAYSVVQPEVTIGDHCIINTKASVDHDCKIGYNVHISPGSTLCGNVVIGNHTHIGAGTTILPCIKIGNNVIIGASSMVNKDIFDNSIAYGVPCKYVKDNITYSKI